MNLTETTRIRSMVLALTIPLVLMFFVTEPQCAQAGQKSSDELLLEIMDLHSQLVTNETFIAQAKLLGAYVEAAQPLEESKKIKIYSKVLNILAKIKDSTIQIPAIFAEPESGASKKSVEKEGQERKSVYEPGAALLEIFKIDPKKKEIPDLPVIRTYWKRDLAWKGAFPVPERVSEIGGQGATWFANFSFYYEAKQSGKYGFTIVHNQQNGCGLTIGGIDVVIAKPGDSSAQGMCNLKKGFHRVEFGVGKHEEYRFFAIREDTGSFHVRVLTPDSFDSVPLTKDMMLLKKE